MTRRKAEQRSREISEALKNAGFGDVVAEVDRDDITYLIGAVPSAWEKGEAVQVALDHGAELIVDGVDFPGMATPAIERHYHVGPYPHHVEPPESDAQRIYRASDLSSRVFDAPRRSLSTGTSLIGAS